MIFLENGVGDIQLQTKVEKSKKNSGSSGPTPVARGGSGAKTPALAARPSLRKHGWE
jgi:hypothetical protein